MNQRSLFETPVERAVLSLPEELREVHARMFAGWGTDALSRGAWINQLGAFGASEPEEAFRAMEAAGVIVSEAGRFRLEKCHASA